MPHTTWVALFVEERSHVFLTLGKRIVGLEYVDIWWGGTTRSSTSNIDSLSIVIPATQKKKLFDCKTFILVLN